MKHQPCTDSIQSNPRWIEDSSAADELYHSVQELMFWIDAGYELLADGLDDVPWLEELEVTLETTFCDLEWTLSDADEGDDSDFEPDVDDEPGVEEQFVRIGAEYNHPRNPHYGGRPESARCALEHALLGACLPFQHQGMAPSRLEISPHTDLLAIACELHRDRTSHLETLHQASVERLLDAQARHSIPSFLASRLPPN